MERSKLGAFSKPRLRCSHSWAADYARRLQTVETVWADRVAKLAEQRSFGFASVASALPKVAQARFPAASVSFREVPQS
ncbi:hypothetical protein MPC4_110027 [Methylocella tundrae]|uniref:Uncharacterized protein n=1 Tax=Methylocella tundrae TaxID=227605 RepID=A0A8B6M118_METTU|nr:hypothetical protein MPC1_4580003 [Methylocella tundrae]VTZ48727.1 hypothetical protein MPC4_110027 [Methylocella tundrae]